eukprot:TRINITY_DN66574_c6_g1_i1.p1 TRINITY_DN66574_c6_g1~~TRINITY_DN66574_c6_g1_i1.p1  ORF type:complete len:294 (+),score=20.94 TRINITY_DN66574_c6_g1_i1:39-884(+)
MEDATCYLLRLPIEVVEIITTFYRGNHLGLTCQRFWLEGLGCRYVSSKVSSSLSAHLTILRYISVMSLRLKENLTETEPINKLSGLTTATLIFETPDVPSNLLSDKFALEHLWLEYEQHSKKAIRNSGGFKALCTGLQDSNLPNLQELVVWTFGAGLTDYHGVALVDAISVKLPQLTKLTFNMADTAAGAHTGQALAATLRTKGHSLEYLEIHLWSTKLSRQAADEILDAVKVLKQQHNLVMTHIDWSTTEAAQVDTEQHPVGHRARMLRTPVFHRIGHPK